MIEIREAFLGDADIIANLIREANISTANIFGINQENCPKHPSFCEESWVIADFKRGERYFMLAENTLPVACVAYESKAIPSEKTGGNKAYLNRLSVLPEHQNKGFGLALTNQIINLARSNEINVISIGIIAQHSRLLCWYENIGFIKGDTKRFDHLPFAVTYMSYDLS